MGGAIVRPGEIVSSKQNGQHPLRRSSHGGGGLTGNVSIDGLEAAGVVIPGDGVTNKNGIAAVEDVNFSVNTKYGRQSGGTTGAGTATGSNHKVETHVKEDIYHDKDGNEVSVTRIHEMQSQEGNLIINYLPLDLDEQQLQNLFTEFGQITQVKIIRDKNTKKSLGYGFVKFTTKEEADAAIVGKNGYTLGVKKIKVSLARPPSEDIKDSKIFVQNLPMHWEDKDVIKFFSECGEIIEVRLLIKKSLVAFVQFKCQKQCQKALAMDGIHIEGAELPLIIKLANVQFVNKNKIREVTNQPSAMQAIATNAPMFDYAAPIYVPMSPMMYAPYSPPNGNTNINNINNGGYVTDPNCMYGAMNTGGCVYMPMNVNGYSGYPAYPIMQQPMEPIQQQQQQAAYIDYSYMQQPTEIVTIRLSNLPTQIYDTPQLLNVLSMHRIMCYSASLEVDRRTSGGIVGIITVHGINEAQNLTKYLNGAILLNQTAPIHSEIVSFKRI